jgi:hypothetical protein
MTTGAYLDDAGTPAAATLTLGFIPRYIYWLNFTDSITYEWHSGMTATQSLKTLLNGTRSLDTGTIFTVGTDGTVVVGAAAIIQNKVNYWVAY